MLTHKGAKSITDFIYAGVQIPLIPQTGDSCQAALKTADNMPYEAKGSGRNRVAWMDEDGKQLFEK